MEFQDLQHDEALLQELGRRLAVAGSQVISQTQT